MSHYFLYSTHSYMLSCLVPRCHPKHRAKRGKLDNNISETENDSRSMNFKYVYLNQLPVKFSYNYIFNYSKSCTNDPSGQNIRIRLINSLFKITFHVSTYLCTVSLLLMIYPVRMFLKQIMVQKITIKRYFSECHNLENLSRTPGRPKKVQIKTLRP